MDVVSFKHKALRRFFETDRTRGLRPEWVPKLRRMLTALNDAKDMEELESVPSWRLHQLTGDREGTYALRVTANWRLTFRPDDEGGIHDIDLEDYH